MVDICAHLFTEIRDLIDKGDLGGQKGIGCIFDHLRRLQGGNDEGSFDEVKGAVMSFMIAMACSLSAPRVTRSGRIKSSTADPSLWNSGLETISKGEEFI
jgi:hypothetical protein